MDKRVLTPFACEVWQWAAILLLCVAAAVSYGVTHDQITARLCVEYFTVGHPPLFRTQSPTLLAIGWGIVATWWVGAILAFPVAIAARWGRRPKLGWHHLVRPIAVLMVVAALLALAAGCVGHGLASNGTVALVGRLAERVPRDKQVWYLAVGFAHSTSYLVGFLGGIMVVLNTWWRRRMIAGGLEPLDERPG